jgi:hypothetical protein
MDNACVTAYPYVILEALRGDVSSARSKRIVRWFLCR